jgi:hypothetical protein
MSDAVKRRLLVMIGVSLALLPLTVFSISSAHEYIDDALRCFPLVHVILEAFLNFLWAVVGIASFAHLLSLYRSKIHTRQQISVSLIFVMALLFHVISADDELSESLINDAANSQSISSTLKCGHERTQRSYLYCELATQPIDKSAPCIPRVSDLVLESNTPETIEAPRNASGNHSPPYTDAAKI